MISNVGKVAGSALLALSLGLNTANAAPAISTPSTNTLPTITLSKAQLTEDDLTIQSLEAETKAEEAKARSAFKKARIEKSREAFFDYEAKMANEQEKRIEEAERKAELEAENDKAEVETLAILELKKEREVALAGSKEERAAKLKEAKVSSRFGCC
jgi:hypothetical protein